MTSVTTKLVAVMAVILPIAFSTSAFADCSNFPAECTARFCHALINYKSYEISLIAAKSKNGSYHTPTRQFLFDKGIMDDSKADFRIGKLNLAFGTAHAFEFCDSGKKGTYDVNVSLVASEAAMYAAALAAPNSFPSIEIQIDKQAPNISLRVVPKDPK